MYNSQALADEEDDTGEYAEETAFDAYFLLNSKPSRTSSNVFSDLVPPLTPEEHTAAIKRVSESDAPANFTPLWQDDFLRKPFFSRCFTELHEGFNLIFYGFGSKRYVLNAFAKAASARGGHVIVANGFQPSFGLKDLLGSIEQIPMVEDASLTGAGVEAQSQRIHEVFSSSQNDAKLYLIIHNLDSPALRTAKAKACLSLIALSSRIHIVASVDHINASQRWSFTELFARKPDPGVPEQSTKVPSRGFAWLWHDLTTLAPYDFELAFADPTSIYGVSALRGGRARDAAVAGANGAPGTVLVTESAARHVLASVTDKAKKLFVLLGARQLEIMPEGAGAGAMQPAEGAFDYERLFGAARDNFVATSDTALRALLGEFRDHGLVVSNAGTAGAGEMLWIPMRRDALAKIVGELKQDQ
ncbi:hypothetical protein CERSUDRAFT_107574 [Gelatoporia subvermispora B]|uniref:Origin recognition complex subunit 2 n=1 Tax=Ceriporiopsis subvermispora (strain B) TaxID=914234 RepID=M2R7K7_CERS8|nr:hypothetical protein CERSUDRAFT_107574 [Gelatoporia subvermispora B]